MRRISWFSCGTASAVVNKLAQPDIISYCDEDEDNERFLRESEEWFEQPMLRLRTYKYRVAEPLAPECDFLCGLAEEEIRK